mgnify:CR=1 FL=1
MNEIICPHCDKAFKVDETGYADILKQVRDSEFNREITEKLERAQKDKDSALEIAEQKAANSIQQTAAEKDLQIERLKSELKEKEFSVNSTVEEAVRPIEKARDSLENQLKSINLEKELLEKNLKEKYETQLRDKDDSIERLRDMKTKLSTKMVGETLEQHCEIEFNRLRSSAFPTAYFEKDNDASEGSKGDYIFKDHDQDGTEIISIMFEMKNENDFTATKSKNEDFLKELDKDRNQKGCEYAVLVSMLEAENELYNTGIVDVSHRFSKMYVVRPQFFIPIISLLKNAAKSSLEYKTELARVKNEHIDITNFEAELEKEQAAFGKNVGLAGRKLKVAIDQIDKSINGLQKTKDAIISTANNFRFANDKIQGITIKRLTKGNATMAAKFAELKDEQ